MSTLQSETLVSLIRFYKDDADMVELIMDAIKSFEAYHASIYKLEAQKYLYSAGVMDAETYREEIPLLDQQRTNCHNQVLSNVQVLNRLAEKAGLPYIYDGVISRDQPYRREVADAILSYVGQVMLDRS